MLIIACLSQKGGVGKSTLARLMACAYASAGWRTKIADFNVKQKTSVDWAANRMSQQITPEIAAEAYADIRKVIAPAHQAQFDLVVIDGKPDSDTQTADLAKSANLILIPTGVSADDLVPQIRFAQELLSRGVPKARILFILNKSTDSQAAISDARNLISSSGFDTTSTDLPHKTGYLNAQNIGRCLSETAHASLNARAEALAQEVVSRLEKLTG